METEIVTHGQRRSHLGNLSNIGRLPLPLSGFQVIRTLNAILISPTRKLAQQLFFFCSSDSIYKPTGINLFTLHDRYIWHDHLKAIFLHIITI